jgi:hypothetical protein
MKIIRGRHLLSEENNKGEQEINKIILINVNVMKGKEHFGDLGINEGVILNESKRNRT